MQDGPPASTVSLTRKCIHCPHEGPDDTFGYYRDRQGTKRPTNVCKECVKRHARHRQAEYKERHGDRVRQRARDARYIRYHSDPEFRQRCLDSVKKTGKNT